MEAPSPGETAALTGQSSVLAATPSRSPESSDSRRLRLILAALIALLTVVVVFVVPFLFPPAYPTRSASYVAGFNNRVAAIAAASMALLTLSIAWRWRLSPCPASAAQPRGIPPRLLMLCLAAALVFNAGLGWLLCSSQTAYNDNLYFLQLMGAVVHAHRRVYSDFPFLYGPLLLDFPLAVYTLLRPLGASLQASYYVALALAETAGVGLLYLTLHALPLSPAARKTAFVILTLCALCPLLGLNYCLIRALLPFSALLFAARIRTPWLSALAFFSIEWLQLSVSAELGFAFAAGACFYALCRSIQSGVRWIPAIATAPAGAALFLAILGRPYLNSIESFSRGSLNLVVEPLPYILFFLVALVWLVPLMVAGLLRHRRPQAVLMASLFVVSLALLPAALGRCDPLHVIYNGLGIFLLGTVAIDARSSRVRGLWFLSLECLLVWNQILCFSLFSGFLVPAFIAATTHKAPPALNMSRLEAVIGSGKVAIPFQIPYSIEMQLERSGHYLPDGDCFLIDVWDARAEAARISRMDRQEWAIVPAAMQRFAETPGNSFLFIGPSFNYPWRRTPFVSGDLIDADLHAHWTAVARFNDLTLYRRGPGGGN